MQVNRNKNDEAI